MVDGATAKALCEGLVAAGCLLWVDDAELRTSEPWRDQVRSGIDDARVLPVVFSEAWVTSPACAFERNYACERQKPLVIALAGGSTLPTEVPAALRDGGVTWVSREESLSRTVETTASWLLASRGPRRRLA